MNSRYKMIDRFAKITDLPGEPLPGVPLIELSGDSRVLIENHCGVIEYGCNEICIKVCYGKIAVRGNLLKLAIMTKYQLVITGAIDCVAVERGAK